MNDHYIYTFQDQIRADLIQKLINVRYEIPAEKIVEEAEQYFNWIFKDAKANVNRD